jgi:sugar/nucleoside kinase (ribokinase family)
VIKVSDVELEFLTGSNKIDDETALTLWRPSFKLLLVTLGENGCKYYTKVSNYSSVFQYFVSSNFLMLGVSNVVYYKILTFSWHKGR